MIRRPKKFPQYGRSDLIQIKHYLNHIERVQIAKSIVDCQSPRIVIKNFGGGIAKETIQFWKTHNSNIRLLNNLLFTKSVVQTINPKASYPVPTNNQIASIKRAEKILSENIHLENQISAFERLKIRRKKQRSPLLTTKLIRPNIYIDLVALKERSIGRVTFQLYPEACPFIVNEILRYVQNCQGQIHFPRVFTSLWAEGEIYDLGLKAPDDIKCDCKILDNGNSAGIMSIDPMDFRLLKKGLIVFSISFKPLSIANGKRVAFGRLIKGSRNLYCLREYGNRDGVPQKKIVASSFGVPTSIRRVLK